MNFKLKPNLPRIAGIGVCVTGMLASSADGTVITVDNLLTAGGTYTDAAGAIYRQAEAKSGTGLWAPFLSLNSSKGVLQGYNTDANADPVNNPDIVTGGSRTRSVTFGQLGVYLNPDDGLKYVRFLLDINEPNNSSRYLALNSFQIFAPTPGSFANYTGPVGGLNNLLYSFDTGGDRTMLLDYSISQGSGSSDLELLVPLSVFSGLGSSFGRSIVIESTMGDTNGISAAYGAFDFRADAGGFEEWNRSTQDTPVAVPEASTVVFGLAMLGGLGFVEVRRRQKQALQVVD